MSVLASQRIDFHQLSKPANLKNSAVLRMLEEEDHRRKDGHAPNIKQVIWPPPPDSCDYTSLEEAPVYAQGGPQHPIKQASPINFKQPQSANRFQSVESPESNRWQQPQQQPSPQSVPFQAAQYQGFRPVQYQPEPPPSTIILRPSPPMTQEPAPVYASQPATATLNGGSNMRGDMKWPPENVRAQTAAENEQRRSLAKGPACRPRKVKKDYSSFFAQHALNSTYPGYRAPPGTQHYADEQPGISNF